jgi:threonine aldolase
MYPTPKLSYFLSCSASKSIPTKAIRSYLKPYLPPSSLRSLTTSRRHYCPTMPTTAPASAPNAWSAPGPAAFDFRSDVVTTPTTNMLNAITACTLLDDVFLEDPTTNDLERFVSELTGKEAALLVLSGTMGNQVAMRSHLGSPPNAILCDQRAHVLQYEAGGASSLSGALIQGVTPANGTYLTYEEVVEHTVISDDVHGCPTKVISLENTLNGNIMPLGEVKKISGFARNNGIIMHLDGARLWEAVVAGAGSLKEYCQYFDSASLCFSKGLGAPIGSILVGTKPFIQRARWIRKMLGGGLRQAGVVSAAARVALEDTFLGGQLKQSHERAKAIAKLWEGLGGKLQYPVETNMVWLDVESAGLTVEDFVTLAKERGVRVNGGRMVVHYQISDEAVQRLELLMRDILVEKKGRTRAML